MRIRRIILSCLVSFLLSAEVPLRAAIVKIDSPGAGLDATERIQQALDGGAEGDVVQLGPGVYELSAELMVTNGVRLAGEGWEKTTLRQVSTTNRVMTIKGGATVDHLTLTGGAATGKNYVCGGGACVFDGTISWCCVSNNVISAAGHNAYGGGIGFPEHGKGQVDHTLIVDNVCESRGGTLPDSYGGGIGVYKPDGAILVDTCLIRGNRSIWTPQHLGCGGGIGLNYIGQPVVVRNTTIVENRAGETGAETAASGGAIFLFSNWAKQKVDVFNCIIAGNSTAGNPDCDVALLETSSVDFCLFDKSADLRGANSLTGDPQFKNPGLGKFMLTARSPAWKTGRPYPGIGQDLVGADFAENPSMGCYEFIQTGFTMIFR